METDGHAFRNASSAQSWIDCAQYPIFKRWHIDNEVPIPEGDMSHAERGTKLHDIMETLVRKMLKKPYTYPAELLGSKLVTNLDEHDENQVGIAFVAALNMLKDFGWPHKDVSVALEVPVTLSHEPDSKGRIDLAIITPSVLIVIDYKFGKGEVLATSYQNQIYASNLVLALRGKREEFSTIHMGIIQPEIDADALVEVVVPADLDKWRHYVETTTERQTNGSESRAASHPETCTFCPFKVATKKFRGCPTNQRMILEALDVAEEVTEGTAFPDTMEKFYRAKKMLENALSMARDAIFSDPDQFPSFGRSKRRNPRGFDFEKADEDAIAHYLRKEYDVRDPYKLKSVAQIRKLLPDDADIDKFLLPQGWADVLSMKPPKGK